MSKALEKAKAASIAFVRSTMSSDELRVADWSARLHARYIGSMRDPMLQAALKALVSSIAVEGDRNLKRPDKRRIIGICGESGSGKTMALVEHVGLIPSMQPHRDEDNVEVNHLLFFQAPSPCTPLRFALSGLEALDYPVASGIKEPAALSTFRSVLKARQILYVIVDEAQHTIDAGDPRETLVIANFFKNLVQMPDWPVRLILAGVAPLASFLKSKQLRNRCNNVPFDQLNLTIPTVKGSEEKTLADTEGFTVVAGVLQTVIEDHARLSLDASIDADCTLRLIHACERDFGSVIQMVRGASEIAYAQGRSVVTIKDFAATYKASSGCLDSQNIFTAPDWMSLKPHKAAYRSADFALEREAQLKRSRKALKFGERP